jgi:hypothetical protein
MSDADSSKLSSNLSKKKGEDFTPMLLEIIKSIEYKYYAFMFLIFMFITSDVYIDKVLSKLDGTLEYCSPTPYGTIIQAITLIAAMILIHVLIKKEII